MGNHRAAITPIQAPRRRQRTSARRHAGCSRRHSVDSEDGSAVEVSAVGVSATRHLPPLLSRVVPGRDLAAGLGGGDGGSGQKGQIRLVGGVHRRQLRRRKKRGPAVGKTKCGKGTKRMAVVDGHGLPVGITAASATPAEVKLVEQTIESIPGEKYPERLIGDMAYDSDPLAQELDDKYGIELIAPNRRNRKYKSQDGRPLRRYKRRWKVERLWAWLGGFRRLVVRYDRNLDSYLGFLYLACTLILLRRF